VRQTMWARGASPVVGEVAAPGRPAGGEPAMEGAQARAPVQAADRATSE
jgi:hypothetical protein